MTLAACAHVNLSAAMKRIPTIKDVAKKAGVTHTTVSRVIHNDPRISEPTRQRVLKAIEAVGYEPNLVARGLVRRHTQLIALITPELAPYVLPIVRSVAESCARCHYAAVLFPTNTWQHEALSFEHVARNWLVDGALVYNVVYHETVPPGVLDMQARGLPFVFINKFLNDPRVNAAGVDNEYAVELAVEHLVGLGRKRLAIIYGNPSSVDGAERLHAFQKSLHRRKLPLPKKRMACGYWYEDPAYQETLKMLESPDRPDGIFCANDTMAIGALRAIREKNLRVPQDVAVVGFDDLEAARYVSPPLTTIRPPLFEAGAEAFSLLMDILKNPRQPPRQIKLRSELIVRGSTVSELPSAGRRGSATMPPPPA